MFLASFVRATLGFGDGVLAMPLLTLLMGVRQATPLVALASLLLGAALLARHWSGVNWPAVTRLGLASLAGVPFGFLLLRSGPEAPMRLALGSFLAAHAALNLSGRRLPALGAGRIMQYGVGLFAGVIGGAFNMQGVTVVVFGQVARWSPDTFRSILQAYLFGTTLLLVGGHIAVGLWNRDLLGAFVGVLPGLVAGTLLGTRYGTRWSAQTYNRLVNLVVLCLAAMLMVSGARGL